MTTQHVWLGRKPMSSSGPSSRLKSLQHQRKRYRFYVLQRTGLGKYFFRQGPTIVMICYPYPPINPSRYKDKFSCSRCLKLCPSGAFSDKQIKAKRGKGHAESDRRFCLKCGVKKRIYQPGEPVIVNRHTHYICALCWKLCGSGLFCLGCRACRRCIERKTIIWASLGVVIRPDKIENTCALCSWHYNNLGVSGPERDATN